MKRILLIFACCFLILSGCGENIVQNNSSEPESEVIEVITDDGLVILSDEETKVFIDVFESDEWLEENLCMCIYDCKLLWNGKDIEYASECGTFLNVDETTGICADDEMHMKINDILGKYIIFEEDID